MHNKWGFGIKIGFPLCCVQAQEENKPSCAFAFPERKFTFAKKKGGTGTQTTRKILPPLGLVCFVLFAEGFLFAYSQLWFGR